MTNKISGGKPRIVDEVQSRLNTFTKCSEAHEAARKALDELAAKNVELADRPAHEERRQVLLTQYKKTVDELKASAQKVRDKTNSHHIDKYFRPRRDGINKTLRAGPKDHYYIHPAHKAYLVEIHDVAKEIVTSDYDTPITQAQNESKARKAEALASIEFSQIDQTFPACRERLLIENPAEYLRQAALYQYNLLEKNDATAVVAFGTSWMKNLPKEATWEQVANMSLIVLEGRNADKSVDLTEYRDAVKQWLNEHPLPETLDSVNPPPDQATSPSGQRTYVLGLLHFNNQQLDLSPEAFQLYKSCGSLYPDQHVWKIAQAYYHISKLQWAEAEQILADLPKDDDAVRDTQKFLKVTHAHYHVDHLEWTEAEQLLADLPKDDASVIYTQKYLIAASLQSLNTHFAAPNSETIQSYVDLLVLLASIEGKKDIAARQYARRSLIAFIEKLTSIQCPIPELLKHEMVNILLETARLAKEIGRRNIGLEALDAIRHVGMEDEQLEQYKEYIYVLTGLLNT